MPRGMGLILFAAAALAVAVCGPVEATVAPAAVRVIAEVDQEAVVQLQGRAADSEIEDHSEFSIRRAVDGSCMHFNKADKLLVKLCGEQTLGDGEAGSDLITEVNTLRDQVAELKAEVASLKASQGTQQRSGRIGYWKFDAESCNQANIEDQSGSGNHLQVGGDSRCTPHGIDGGGWQTANSDSNNLKVHSPFGMRGGAAPFTVGAWFKLNHLGPPATAHQYAGLFAIGSTAANQHFYLRANSWGHVTGCPSQVLGKFTLGLDNSGDYWWCNPAAEDTPTGVWMHVVGTFDGRNAIIYVNATVVLQATISPPSLTTDLEFAGDPYGSSNLDAVIDEAVLYNRALPESEVQELFAEHQGFNTPEVADREFGHIASYTFDDDTGCGTSITDVTGHGNDLTAIDGYCTLDGINGVGYQILGHTAPPLARSSLNRYSGFSQPFTLSMWYKRNSVVGSYDALMGVGATGDNEHIYLRERSWGHTNGCPSATRDTFTLGYDSAAGDTWFCNPDGPKISDNVGRWMHVVLQLVREDDGMHGVAWVNGEKLIDEIGTPNIGRNVMFGSDGYAPTLSHIIVDEINMWNRALSPDDIAALFAERADFTSALVPGSVDKLLGRVGYWDFENCDGKTVGGIIPDVSGNGNDLTIGAGSCSPTGGRVGAAWSLAGGTAASNKLYREAIRLYDGGNAPLTVTGWFKFSSLSNYMGTLSVGATGGRQHFYIRAKSWGHTAGCPSAVSGKFTLGLDSGSTDNWFCPASDGVTTASDVWYHVVGTYDGRAGKVFVNGVKQFEGSVSPSAFTTSFTLGGDRYLNNALADGSLVDEVAFYNRPMSDSEVSALYDTYVSED